MREIGTQFSKVFQGLALCMLLLSCTGLFGKQGYVSLFDGESLAGWDGEPRYWRVEDGTIVGESTEATRLKGSTFLIWQGGDVADFELKAEFKLRNHNSGIQYRCFPHGEKPWVVGGYQADISKDNEWTGVAWGAYYKKLLAACGEKAVVGATSEDRQVVGSVGDRDEILANVDPDGWNEYHIVARGNQIIQMINGVVTAEFSESDPEYLKSGSLALQLHGGEPMEVRFRNLRLKILEEDERKEILLLAGKKSHGYNAHEHKAGCLLLARCLNESGLDVSARVVTEGAWPEPWMGFDKPDAIVMYCDGYTRHMAKEHQDKIQSLTEAGVGVACLHFGVEVDPDELGQEFLDWIGGFFEVGWSVNPHWDAHFDALPDHPITNGVNPFTIRDEWYYHMRFQPKMEGVTPILSTLPPLETLTSRKKNKHRGSNPAVLAEVKAGKKQHVAWAYERDNGGRGFGFTGGHFHQNWKQDDFRKLVLNAFAWIAKMEVPDSGISSRTPSEADMALNQDFPPPSQ